MADKSSKKSITAKPVVTKNDKTKTVTVKTPDSVVSIKAKAEVKAAPAKKTAPAKKPVAAKKPVVKNLKDAAPGISPGAAALRKRTQEIVRSAIPT